MENRIIRVKGVGKASMAPDKIKINIELRSSDIYYEKAMKIANEDLEKLREALRKGSFEEEDIKTINFNVDTKYENETDTFINPKRKFIGYEISHSLKIEFENDSLKLGRVLDRLARSKANPEFSIFYSLKDRVKFKDEILKDSIADAKRKASLIAEESGVKLGKISNINYDIDEVEAYSSPFNLQRSMSLVSETMSIVPEDLESSGTVDIAWEIEE